MRELQEQEKKSILCAIDSQITKLNYRLRRVPFHVTSNDEFTEELKEEKSRLENLRKEFY